MESESENDNVKLKQGSHRYDSIMFDLWKDGEKNGSVYTLFLTHFVYICVKVNSRKRLQTSKNRYLVGKDKRKQTFSLFQNPGEGGRQPDLYSVDGLML